jgi:hypothetical protein
MKLTADMSEALKMQAGCRSRHRGPDARILSPLPNLGLEPGAAVAEILHHPMLEPMGGSGLTGRATLSLRGKMLHVSVTADRRVHVDLRRCRAAGAPRHADQSGDLLLVVTSCGPERSNTVSSASFDLTLRGQLGALAGADFRQLSPRDLESVGKAALQNLALGDRRGAGAEEGRAPAQPPAAARALSEDAYFLGRIKDEIGAALRAEQPGVASRHVQIATLMARRLQRLPPVAALESRRTG